MRVEGACHCGRIRFAAELPDGLASARRCDCPFCAMRGAVAVSAPIEDFDIIDGAEHLKLYTFNTGTARHYFCRHCGIYTHHLRRSNPDEYGVNLACIEGATPFLSEVNVTDGQNHPSDGAPPRIVGTLRYEPRE
ncbi:GFA family protein [Palleronia sp. LCG004]|uniref:GFA family protein n=1 Tax=Palleronia sp. LCG004 TaxID=3079304 RepID=UPI0029431628|nr:GFA family protein [Palleronia sp. LCG004]WOI56886.1 GFA family protein [Palleronia sp. LCG004]